ncbi:hypothetical protein [Gordonia terrae]
MERTEMERRAREHGEAVVAGDQPRIIADIVEELHPVVPQLAATLPQPLEGARVVDVEVSDDHADTVIEYSGPTATLKVKSRWENRGGATQIVSATPL